MMAIHMMVSASETLSGVLVSNLLELEGHRPSLVAWTQYDTTSEV